MMNPRSEPFRPPNTAVAPLNTWYPIAASASVGRSLLARRLLTGPVVLYRTTSGQAVALEDRCAHRPYPLSLGTLDGDDVISGYTGFRYGPDGACRAVPTQAQVPLGASVRAYPVHDDGAFVWVWAGAPSAAALRPAPSTPWLTSPQWATFGEEWVTQASLDMLQDNFADISHVAVVDPVIAPPVLAGDPPPVQVEVSETSVRFWRTFAPAQVTPWHAEAFGLDANAAYAQREEGHFVAPGLWVDQWDVTLEDGSAATFMFTHGLTPIDARTTRHIWRVSRNVALDEATSNRLEPFFVTYYTAVRSILETMQAVVDADGIRADVDVVADAAGIAVRRIMRQQLRNEMLPHQV